MSQRPGATRRAMRGGPRGFAAMVCYQPKHEVNVGTLWRSAFLYDIAFLGTVGRRYEKQASDTPNTPNKVPLVHYSDIDDLVEHLPYGCPLVGVELDERSVPLSRFCHPPNAVYLVGAEDHGLPPKVLDKCHAIVQIETPNPWSMNVSVAGSMVLRDRYLQGLK
ncbi:RNA methyltransferase, TrmH family [Mycobacterium phage WXIN]|nr:RNA methyltransferase, TrmH family [Mycobacterium phage WXIN]